MQLLPITWCDLLMLRSLDQDGCVKNVLLLCQINIKNISNDLNDLKN